MCRECQERFPHHRLQRKPLVNDLRDTLTVMHVRIATNPQWQGKRRHSRRMRNPQFCVPGKCPMGSHWFHNSWQNVCFTGVVGLPGWTFLELPRRGLTQQPQDRSSNSGPTQVLELYSGPTQRRPRKNHEIQLCEMCRCEWWMHELFVMRNVWGVATLHLSN